MGRLSRPFVSCSRSDGGKEALYPLLHEASSSRHQLQGQSQGQRSCAISCCRECGQLGSDTAPARALPSAAQGACAWEPPGLAPDTAPRREAGPAPAPPPGPRTPWEGCGAHESGGAHSCGLLRRKDTAASAVTQARETGTWSPHPSLWSRGSHVTAHRRCAQVFTRPPSRRPGGRTADRHQPQRAGLMGAAQGEVSAPGSGCCSLSGAGWRPQASRGVWVTSPAG